jgi:hypothetical protein
VYFGGCVGSCGLKDNTGKQEQNKTADTRTAHAVSLGRALGANKVSSQNSLAQVPKWELVSIERNIPVKRRRCISSRTAIDLELSAMGAPHEIPWASGYTDN